MLVFGFIAGPHSFISPAFFSCYLLSSAWSEFIWYPFSVCVRHEVVPLSKWLPLAPWICDYMPAQLCHLIPICYSVSIRLPLWWSLALNASEWRFSCYLCIAGFFGLFPLWADSPLCRILLFESLSASISVLSASAWDRIYLRGHSTGVWGGNKFSVVGGKVLWHHSDPVDRGGIWCLSSRWWLSIQLLYSVVKSTEVSANPQLFSFTFGFSLSLLTL